MLWVNVWNNSFECTDKIRLIVSQKTFGCVVVRFHLQLHLKSAVWFLCFSLPFSCATVWFPWLWFQFKHTAVCFLFDLDIQTSDSLLIFSTNLFIVLVHDIRTGNLFSHLPLPDSIKQFMFMLPPARCRSALSVATNFIPPCLTTQEIIPEKFSCILKTIKVVAVNKNNPVKFPAPHPTPPALYADSSPFQHGVSPEGGFATL